MHHSLPQLSRLFVTDAGLETDLIFNRGMELPFFASITLLRSEAGRSALDDYFRSYLDLARVLGTGCLLESASWRASPDWAPRLGIGLDELGELNRVSVGMLRLLKDGYHTDETPVVVSGCIGPRGDGYDPGAIMSAEEAEDYHSWQAFALAAAGPDLLSAITMTNVNEAIGIAKAARRAGLPVVISFTVETDGRLPTGDTLRLAVEAVDEATGSYPAYYMINCAHPTHFMPVLDPAEGWTRRLGGIRANASRCSHAELDAMTEVDAGDPAELGRLYRFIRDDLPNIQVLGGCCGTDIRHVTAIAKACAAPRLAAVQPDMVMGQP
jgi:S-methylmethionine-dependent homocysteine/selenocysteine methylase